MSLCPKCGKETLQGAAYCRFCGNPLREAQSTEQNQLSRPTPIETKNLGAGQGPLDPSEKMICNLCNGKVPAREMRIHLAKKHSKWWNEPKYTDEMVRERFRPQNPNIATPQAVHLFSTSVTINAGKYYDISFVIPCEAQNPVLKGSFTVRGGSGDDIELYVIRRELLKEFNGRSSLPLWLGSQTGYFYNSGQVTGGTLNLSLPSGKGANLALLGIDDTYYCIVLSNLFSFSASKIVSAIFDLYYRR